MRSELNGDIVGGRSLERLSEELAEYWSRRIDDKNRVGYRMLDGNLVIISCKTHYGDK